MKNLIKIQSRFILIVLLLAVVHFAGIAQQIRWLRVTELQGPYNDIGAEFEEEFNVANGNFFSWPAQYGIEQNTIRSRALWIGCKNFDDPVMGRIYNYKVVGVGPRDALERPSQVFSVEIKLSGKRRHPMVIVDGANATQNDIYDKLDEVDPNLVADRVITIKFNTSIGISVTKKVMAFDSPLHSQYHINEYVFKNTGIYNKNGDVKLQTLRGVYFYFNFRNTFVGEANSGYNVGWAGWAHTWGRSTVNHAVNPLSPEFNDPSSPWYRVRSYYSWYAPLIGGTAGRTTVTYDEDWGCPNEREDGIMASAKYGGIVTLHADKSATDKSDDINQPSTTWYAGSDRSEFQTSNASQYDDLGMSKRYALMSEGHPTPDKQNDVVVGDVSPSSLTIEGRIDAGGASQNIAYGPYDLAPGDSIRIVFAEAVSGLSREKNREVSSNWFQWYKGTGTPTLILPDGSTTTNYNLYKRKWVETCKDSINKTFKRAIENFNSNYNIPKPPPPPATFTVTSGGDRILLEWDRNLPESDPHFDGYVIYRSVGNVLNPKTVYEKIFECNKTNATGKYEDTSAVRGLRYYYYIQSKDDGTQTGTGEVLYSSLFWTITNTPATLQRMAGNYLDELRVVPNPYDVRARMLQFGSGKLEDHDQIAFFGLPSKCKIMVFTERGDLIWEKNHTKPTGDELWYSETMYGQILVSGVYIVYIEVTEDIYALKDIEARKDIYGDDRKLIARRGDIIFRKGELIFRKGDSKFRKFVVIR